MKAMNESLTIGALAKAAGVATSTVRYYEKSGLLKPTARNQSNYRIYGREEVERLRFIRAAQSAGFTLDDIKSLILFRSGETAPCKEVRHLIEHRLSAVEERLKELRHVERHLKNALKACKGAEKEGRCEVLDELSTSSKA